MILRKEITILGSWNSSYSPNGKSDWKETISLIKSGILYRSDKLSYATENDFNSLRKLGIKNIIDLRSINEKEREPNIIPSDFNYIEIPITIDKKIVNEMKMNITYSVIKKFFMN